MQFYLAFPFLVLLFRRFGYLSITIACLALWGISHKLFGVYISSPAKALGVFGQPSFLPLKLECFVFGILIAEAFWFRSLKPHLPMVLLLLAAGMTYIINPSPYLIGSIIFCIYFTFSKGADPVRLNGSKTVEENILSSRLVQFMADTSYSVYLIHFPVLRFVTSFFATQTWYISLSLGVRFVILLGIIIAVTYPLAFILFKLVEQPGIRMGQRVVKMFCKWRENKQICRQTVAIS